MGMVRCAPSNKSSTNQIFTEQAGCEFSCEKRRIKLMNKGRKSLIFWDMEELFSPLRCNQIQTHLQHVFYGRFLSQLPSWVHSFQIISWKKNSKKWLNFNDLIFKIGFSVPKVQSQVQIEWHFVEKTAFFSVGIFYIVRVVTHDKSCPLPSPSPQ